MGEFMAEVGEQVRKRKWKMLRMVQAYGTLSNVVQLTTYPVKMFVYGPYLFEFRWYAIVEGKADKSEISDRGLHTLKPAPSWDICAGVDN
jgi:hypothetical protein